MPSPPQPKPARSAMAKSSSSVSKPRCGSAPAKPTLRRCKPDNQVFGQELKMSFKIPYRAGVFAPALFASMVAAGSAFAQAAEPTVNKGDNAWMLISTVLVLLMTIPGLALFYGGLVRSKNMLSVLAHVFYCVCIVTLIW